MLTLLLSMNTIVFAEDFNVSYEGDAEKFIFVDGNSSIFENFKDIAPGEVRTQKITLTNNDSERMRFFMKTTATDELGDADAVFIITISRDGTELYSGTIQGLRELSSGAMEDSLMLADLSKGESANVEMTLEVDETLPSDVGYENQQTDIQFIFAVDNPPENEGTTTTETKKGEDKTVYKKGSDYCSACSLQHCIKSQDGRYNDTWLICEYPGAGSSSYHRTGCLSETERQ